jgi:glutamyl-tRNA synthetase/glutamyl-Q tRNA(Asp) synthetase
MQPVAVRALAFQAHPLALGEQSASIFPAAMYDLDTLTRRVPARPRTRFAPSPTGWLHLGHVVNAVWVWGAARALNGRVILRIEDHDRTRSRAEYEHGLLEDLAWLGLEPDEDAGRQSDHDDRYAAALAQLDEAGLVYACRCSRRDIAETVPDVFNRETRYPGTCRGLGLAREAGRGLRARLAGGMERFDDLVLGPQQQEPAAQCGDVLVRDRLGQWTYQFAVVVDDIADRVDLVIRGEDLLESTGRQISLARMLGRDEPPVFAHHPLIVKPSGEKLSKATGDTGIRELRAGGARPGDVLREAAARSGLPRDLAPA